MSFLDDFSHDLPLVNTARLAQAVAEYRRLLADMQGIGGADADQLRAYLENAIQSFQEELAKRNASSPEGRPELPV